MTRETLCCPRGSHSEAFLHKEWSYLFSLSFLCFSGAPHTTFFPENFPWPRRKTKRWNQNLPLTSIVCWFSTGRRAWSTWAKVRLPRFESRFPHILRVLEWVPRLPHWVAISGHCCALEEMQNMEGWALSKETYMSALWIMGCLPVMWFLDKCSKRSSVFSFLDYTNKMWNGVRENGISLEGHPFSLSSNHSKFSSPGPCQRSFHLI